jgi:peptide chain release factor 1
MSNTVDPKQLRSLGREYSELSGTIELIVQREEQKSSLLDLELMIDDDDAEIASIAVDEMVEVKDALELTEKNLISLLTPKDVADERGVVVEVRSGTGGDEASLFAGELFRMYEKYASTMGWKWELLDLSVTDIGGFKGAQAAVSGHGVFEYMKHESGVHRVQRVPVNDKKIQTSAASVVVLPEAEDVDVDIKQSDLQIDVFRASGAGGQSVNKTESAVRITHLPTGCSVAMQDERCQHQNKEKAMKILRAKVYDLERQRAMQERNELVSAAGGTGARSDKIRTYNFPQDRITDHRINITLGGIDRLLSGETLGSLLEELRDVEKTKKFEDFLANLSSS